MAPKYVTSPHIWFDDAPFRTASSFSSPLFINNFLDGKGGKWLDYERQFIARLQKQRDSPIRGRRVPCEARDWNDRDPETQDHPFFGNRASSDAWDYPALIRDERPGANKDQPALTVKMQKYLLIQIGLAREFGMKTEFVIDFTLKHSGSGESVVGWNVIGQAIRQTAAFLRLVHIGEWDTGIDGNAIGHPTNQKADDRIREMFDAVKGPIDHLIAYELHNEFDAHSGASWAKDGMDYAAALAEVNRQLERSKRLKDGAAEQWPEGAVWVSHGGRDTIDYDPTFADAIAVHPSRPSMEVGDRFRPLRKYERQIYANEILHYIDPSLWWTVEQGWFRPGSSTQDARGRARFVDEMLDDGMCVCDHSLTNMSNGRWKDADQDFEEMPLDRYELLRGAGGVKPPPKPEPEPKPEKYRFRKPIQLAYLQLHGRPVDSTGLTDYNGAMMRGMTEAEMRESILRSPEYANANPNTAEPPPPPPPPPDAVDPRAYIRWACEESAATCRDRFAWSARIDSAYTPWRGHRDLASLLTTEGRRYLEGGDLATIDRSAADIQADITRMEEAYRNGARLSSRIETEQHVNFDPSVESAWHRSQVRKDVANAMIGRLERETAAYHEIANQLPAVPGCDSISCKVKKGGLGTVEG